MQVSAFQRIFELSLNASQIFSLMLQFGIIHLKKKTNDAIYTFIKYLAMEIYAP